MTRDGALCWSWILEETHAGSHSSGTMLWTCMLWDWHHKVYRQIQNLCIMVVIILYVFFQCSRKAPETQNSQRYRFPFVMLVSHVLPNSEHFPHWWQLCVPAPAPCLLFRCLVDRPYPDNKQEDSTWILTQDDSGQYWTHHHNFHFLWVLMFACGHSGDFEVVMFPNGCCD